MDYVSAIPTVVWPLILSVPLYFKKLAKDIKKPLVFPFLLSFSAFSYTYLQHLAQNKEMSSADASTPRDDPSAPKNLLQWTSDDIRQFMGSATPEDKQDIAKSIRKIDGDDAKYEMLILSRIIHLIPLVIGGLTSWATKKYLNKHFD